MRLIFRNAKRLLLGIAFFALFSGLAHATCKYKNQEIGEGGVTLQDDGRLYRCTKKGDSYMWERAEPDPVTIHIFEATWGHGGVRNDIAANLRSRCEGKTRCGFQAGVGDLGPVPNASRPHDLWIRWRCGNGSVSERSWAENAEVQIFCQ